MAKAWRRRKDRHPAAPPGSGSGGRANENVGASGGSAAAAAGDGVFSGFSKGAGIELAGEMKIENMKENCQLRGENSSIGYSKQ